MPSLSMPADDAQPTRRACQHGPLYALRGVAPQVAPDAFIAPNAAVIGDVRIAAGASVWFSAVVRGDDMPICIGEGTNVQDGAIVHATEDVSGVRIGANVVIGHAAVLHGCSVEDEAMIGIGAIVLDGAVVGRGAIVAAGALVPPGRDVPAGQLWIGNPGSVRRPVSDAERAFLRYAPSHYRLRAAHYRADGIGGGAA